MAANDYHVVVYQILAYLYNCLKNDTGVNPDSIEKFREDSHINERYWEYIWTHLYKSKLIGEWCSSCCITPLGINYLVENGSMKRSRRFIVENDLPRLA